MGRLFLLCFCTFVSTTLLAQLKIDNEGRLGIGGNPDSDSRLHILNGNWRNGLKLNAEPSTDNNYYGIQNRIFSDRASNNYGIFNEVYGDLGGFNHGMYNRAFHYGSGRNIGILNYSRHYGTGEHIALYNLMWYDGSGDKTGIYTFLGDDINNNSNSTSSMYGTRTHLRAKHFPKVYGHHVQVTNSGYSSTARDLFGIFVLTDGFQKDNVYGIYSHVSQDKNSSDKAYAGYFTGDVVQNGSIIFTSDARLKKNVKQLNGALNIVDKLNPTSYTFLEGNRFGYDPDQVAYGFMAQEVAEILPDLVVDINHPEVVESAPIELTAAELDPLDSTAQQSERVLSSTLNNFQNKSQRIVRHEAQKLKGIKYVELIPILTQAIKEQQLQIDELRILNNPLKNFAIGKDEVIVETDRINNELTQIQDSIDILAGQVAELRQQNTELSDEHGSLREDYRVLVAEVRDLHRTLDQLSACTDCKGGATGALPLRTSPSKVTLYPNPADAQVTIRYAENHNYTVRVLTSDGRLVGTRKSTNHVTRVDVGELPAGNYTIEVTQDDHLIERLPLVIQ